MATGALVGLAGTAAAGAATRLASRRNHRSRVLGISIPAGLSSSSLDPKRLSRSLDLLKVTDRLDLKNLVRRVGDVAEQIEARSDEVRILSGQAKRLSRKLS